MNSLSDFERLPAPQQDPLLQEISEILDLRRRVLAGSDAGYLPPLARLLIEDEIPRLIALLAAPRGNPAARQAKR